MGRCLGITVNLVSPCRCLNVCGVGSPTVDRRSNFFSPTAHPRAVTYMTEILLIMTLINQFTSHQQDVESISVLNLQKIEYGCAVSSHCTLQCSYVIHMKSFGYISMFKYVSCIKNHRDWNKFGII